MDRLYATHHERVHATKACSYLSFWVRKLKPISDAYPATALPVEGEEIPFEAEVLDINEQVAIHLAIKLARICVSDGHVKFSDTLSRSEVLKVFDRTAKEYLVSSFEDGMSMGIRFENLVYDMRFRTFGPHHLTHMLTHLLREVSQECSKLQAAKES